jgi:hypothetical protein
VTVSDLSGLKEGCSIGACSVIIEDRVVSSCLTLASGCAGKKIETIQGLSKDGQLHRCSKRSSSTADFSAASARRVILRLPNGCGFASQTQDLCLMRQRKKHRQDSYEFRQTL